MAMQRIEAYLHSCIVYMYLHCFMEIESSMNFLWPPIGTYKFCVNYSQIQVLLMYLSSWYCVPEDVNNTVFDMLMRNPNWDSSCTKKKMAPHKFWVDRKLLLCMYTTGTKALRVILEMCFAVIRILQIFCFVAEIGQWDTQPPSCWWEIRFY